MFIAEGRQLLVGAEIGRGGEGRVVEVVGREDVLAKIYHIPGPQHSAKIHAMLELQNPLLAELTAWPLATLADENATVCGFLMKRVLDRASIYKLYNPRSRRVFFPEADFSVLLRAAAHVARAFAVVHEHGLLVGDVNHSNILVSSQGDVTLIDCDSFQLAGHTCDVGASGYTPPELLGAGSLQGVQRESNHDNFGLAVIIFQLLFLGRHPFAAGERLEQAIQEHRFAFAEDVRPPGSPPLGFLPDPLPELFLKAFQREAARPGPRDWITALENLTLQTCDRVPLHRFPKDGCPWCPLELSLGLQMFGGPAATGFDVEQFWKEVRMVPNPGHSPSLPPPRRPGPSPHILAYARRRGWRRLAVTLALAASISAVWVRYPELMSAAAVTALILLVWGWNRGEAAVRQNAALELQQARSQWLTISRRWRDEAGCDRFTTALGRILELRNQYITRRLRDVQLENHLVAALSELISIREHTETARTTHLQYLLRARYAFLQADSNWQALH